MGQIDVSNDNSCALGSAIISDPRTKTLCTTRNDHDLAGKFLVAGIAGAGSNSFAGKVSILCGSSSLHGRSKSETACFGSDENAGLLLMGGGICLIRGNGVFAGCRCSYTCSAVLRRVEGQNERMLSPAVFQHAEHGRDLRDF